VGPGASPSPPLLTSAPHAREFLVEERRRPAPSPPQFHLGTANPRLLHAATASRGGKKHAELVTRPFFLLLRLVGFADELAPPCIVASPDRAPNPHA